MPFRVLRGKDVGKPQFGLVLDGLTGCRLAPIPSATDSSKNANAEQIKCVICTKTIEGKLQCGRCKSSLYCSVKCQTEDWPCHKRLCKKMAEMPARPSRSHYLGIFFPQDHPQPQLVWVWCDNNNPYVGPKVAPFIGKDVLLDLKFIQRNPVRGGNLGHTIEFTFRDGFFGDGSKPNRSIHASVEAHKGVPYDWRGPVLALRKKGDDEMPTIYEDITMRDYRHALDYLLWYGLDPRPPGAPSDVPLVDFAPRKKHGVMMLSSNGHVRYRSVSIPLKFVIRNEFPEGEISPVSVRLGLPIRVFKVRPSKEDEHEHPPSGMSNDLAQLLFIELNVSSSEWGHAPARWTVGSIGPVLLVREDNIPLHIGPMPGRYLEIAEAELLCKFCQEKLKPLLLDGQSGGQDEKRNVVDSITKENLERFKNELLDREKK